MRSSLCTLALFVFLGVQPITGRPLPSSSQAASQILELLQGSGIQQLSAADLNALLQNLAPQSGAAEQQGAAEGEGEAVAGEGEGEAASEFS